MIKIMTNELITVIVPVYKVEAYLERCVKSIISQSYRNLEIILVDDGSPDASPKMCDDWAKKDERIKVIHKENGGLSDARNIGVDAAIGRYVCFIDSDDYIGEKFVETLYDLIMNCHTDVSAVGFREVTEDDFAEKITEDGEVRIFEGEDSIRELFFNATYANYACNKMYKKELFESIKFPVDRKMEDLGTTYKLLLAATKIAFSTKPLYFYYQRDDSILHKRDRSFYKDKFELSLERYDVIADLYPSMKENVCFFLKVILEVYPQIYGLYEEYNWKKNAKVLFQQCKKELDLKTKIKYIIFEYNNFLYLYIQKRK